MAVTINQLTTEVIPEPELSPAGTLLEDHAWDILERAREAYARLMCERSRTAAEAFDD